jgi:DHA1 family bicyclomycin/chloramphenicol resistance-like MFS transporter
MPVSGAHAPGGSTTTSVRPSPLSVHVVPRPTARVVLLLGVLVALGPFTIDMYLPALPVIAPDLGSTPAAVQLTLTGTLAGVAAGQLVIGPLSDALGRRRPLVAGVAVHVVASLLCVLAPTVAVLGVLRAFQGFGAAAASVVGMAVVRDLFSGRAAATLFSRLMLVIGASPVLAPTVGGEVLRWSTWRAVFAVLALLGTGVLALAARSLPETLPSHRRRDAGGARAVRTYAALLGDRAFAGLALVGGLVMASLFGYVSGSPFVFQNQFGLSQQEFALVFGSGAVALIGATQLTARLLRRWTTRQILVAGLSLGTASGAVLVAVTALSSITTPGLGGLPVLLVLLWLVLAGQGLTFPTIPALAMSRYEATAGSAAALLGAAQCGVAALAAPVVGLLGTDALAMALTLTGGMLAAGCVLALVVGPRRLSQVDAAAEAAEAAVALGEVLGDETADAGAR